MSAPLFLSKLARPRSLPFFTPIKVNLASVRRASSSASPSKQAGGKKFSRGVIAAAAAVVAGAGCFYVTDTRSAAHRYIVPPIARTLFPDGELAHAVTVYYFKYGYMLGLHPRERGNPDANGDLMANVFGYNITNPIGISAGLDKDADIPDPLFDAGAGIVEVGGITPLPQPGNAKPRVFRIPSQQAIINRYGLNSKGADAVAVTLQKRVQDFARKEGFGRGAYAEKQVLDGAAGVPPGSLTDGKLLAIQIAKNKVTPNDDIDAIKRDYVYCVERLGKYADILVVNVSSPNTPGLRDLQATEPLTKILSGVVNAARSTERRTKPFVMVKVSPDEESKEQMAGVCAAVWASGVDGVIVGNTTQKRPVWENQKLSKQEQEVLKEAGGFSGPHLAKHTIDLVGRYRRMLDQPINDGIIKPRDVPQEEVNQNEGGVLKKLPQLPDAATWDKNSRKVIFASGGMTTGKDVIEAQKAGATAAMLYTGMVYTGPGTITRMKNEMRGIKESGDRMKKLPQ